MGRTSTGPYVQVSRLGNPLFNEVLVPAVAEGQVERVSAAQGRQPVRERRRAPRAGGAAQRPYPGAFPNLAAYTKPRADLEAILLTGIPAGVVSPTFSTFTGTTQADMLRLNLAIPPASHTECPGRDRRRRGRLPNGRRVTDDVVTIELRAVAGATIPLVDKTFTPDKAIADVSDGDRRAGLTLLSTFPYLGTPYSGYNTPS